MRQLLATPLLIGTLLASFWHPTSGASVPAVYAGQARFPGTLVVIKHFGAALRSAPSSSATIGTVLTCGATLRVEDAAGGWYHVSIENYDGWVGGARVADASNPPAYDCTDAYTFQPRQHGYSYVTTGCLSLRTAASRRAAYRYCVRNFHDYTVLNGPIEVAGEDWFQVSSRSTGSGWALAVYLLPYHLNG